MRAAADRAWEDKHAPQPERSLWASVVQLAVDDAKAGEGLAWFDSGWAATVCDLAGLDRDAVRSALRRRLREKQAA